MCPLIARRVGIALPVFRHGASVSCAGPAADCQRAVWSWERQTQTSQVAVAPLEGLDAFQAVGAAWRFVTGPVKPVLRLRHPHAALCKAVHLCRLVPLLLHADGGSAQGSSLPYVFRVTDCLGRFAAAQELLITAALLERLRAAESLLSGEGDPVTCLV